jgi:DNA polymerase III subunit alpha
MAEISNKPKIPFCHLHNHSYFSLLDGLSSPLKLVEAAVDCGFSYLALTDHGSCGGLLAFQKACVDKGIKPILGNEFYITKDRFLKDKTAIYYHLVLIAKNHQGIKNLMKLTSLADMEGKYRYGRIDFELLKKHHEGLICTSACCGGELPKLIWNNQNTEAEALIEQYKNLFGDDYYIEVMRHEYNAAAKDQEKKENELAIKLYEIGKKMGVKVIATNDAHYARRTDAKYHDILLSIQTLDTIKNPDRFTFNSEDFYLKSYNEMVELFKDMPETLSNTMEIVNKVEENLLHETKDLLPEYVVPTGYADEKAYLKALVKDGLTVRGLIDKPEYRERIKVEMELIIRCGFVRYFLILWDIVNFARRSGITVGVGRGSGCGSLCLFVLDITRIDPIKYDLLFERFINPERVSPPDVDMDFEYFRRDEIFEYVYKKYGRNNCCKIGTYNSLKTRAVIRSISKALDLGKDWEIIQEAKKKNPNVKIESKKSLDIADYLAKLVPKGVDMTIEKALRESSDFRNAMMRYPDLVDCCSRIEKTNSSHGVHPAGIVICKNNIYDHVPLKESKGQIASQFTGPEVESLGLLKFDFLALKTLTVVEDTLKRIKERHGLTIDVDKLEPNDKKVFGLFNGMYGSKMDNRGIFQFESYNISKMVKNIRIDTFEDLIVSNALYRPGPLEANVPEIYADYKHGRKKIVYSHPLMESVLKDTYGLMVYQENFMKVSQVLANFTKGQSDTLRKVVGKKKPELIKKEKLDEKFVAGCVKNGIGEAVAKEIFQQIEYFGGYGFNRCLSGDTIVENKADGFKYTLKDLCDYRFGKKYNAEGCKDVVLDSYINGESVEDNVFEVFETGEQELYEVELDNGMIIKCTMEHKFICSDGKKHELKEIMEKDLEIIYE